MLITHQDTTHKRQQDVQSPLNSLQQLHWEAESGFVKCCLNYPRKGTSEMHDKLELPFQRQF